MEPVEAPRNVYSIKCPKEFASKFVTFAVARALGVTTKVSTGTISTRQVRGFVWTGLVSKCIFEEDKWINGRVGSS